MCGGDQATYDRAEGVIAAYAKSCRLMGPSGSGQLTKMVNQICIAGLVQALSEGIHFAKKAGLDVEAVLAVISKGAAQSWQMENRGKTMADGKFDFGFAGRLDAQGPRHLPRSSPPRRRSPSRHGRRGPVLFRGPGHGRQALGHIEPLGSAGALTRRREPPGNCACASMFALDKSAQ